MSTAFFFFRHHLTYKRVACSCCTIKVAHALQVFLKLNNTNQKSLSGPVTLIRIQPTHAENKRKKKKMKSTRNHGGELEAKFKRWTTICASSSTCLRLAFSGSRIPCKYLNKPSGSIRHHSPKYDRAQIQYLRRI